MKNLILLLIPLTSLSQSHYITETQGAIYNKAGSCISPDGPFTESLIIPPNYSYLQDNGYCLYSYPTTSSFTACFTFTANSSSVSVNSGYSQSCNNVSFNNFRLFNSTCDQVGVGLDFDNLTPGVEYRWCLDMRAWGGFSCNGFTNFCPYYINNVVLPVELKEFKIYNIGNQNVISWITSSEINNDYFVVERSENGEDWMEVSKVKGEVNSSKEKYYSLVDYDFNLGQNFYRLSQVDLNGSVKSFEVKAIDNHKVEKVILKRLDFSGREVDENQKGLIIVIFEDNSSSKFYKE
jgi:hypothetical protein